MNATERTLGPRHVAVIGGGRWARVIVGVLTEILPHDVGLSIHATNSVTAIQAWLEQSRFKRRLTVSSTLPRPVEGLRVIVANAARSHGETIRWAIENAIPVLCEKPITLSASRTRELMAEARAARTALYAAHVFLFSNSVQSFARQVKKLGPPENVRVDWCDPQAEWRHGDVKSFDAGVPIHADVTPHVLSILSTFTPLGEVELDQLDVSRGGAQLRLRLRAGVPVTIYMERNGVARRRQLEVQTGAGMLSLDFSAEPGSARVNETLLAAEDEADPSSPLTKMLKTFLDTSSKEEADERLSAELGLRANVLIDAIHARYEQALLPWTAQRRQSGTLDTDMRYRLQEILQKDGPLPADVLEQRVKTMMSDSNLADRSGASWET